MIQLLALFLSISCQGTRFYWETKYEVTGLITPDQQTLNQKFQLTKDMTAWHPIFGKYCAALYSDRANLFVCFKNNEIRIVSSYPGILKGNNPIRKFPDTVKKYLSKIKEEPGFNDHSAIEKFIENRFKVTNKNVRLLKYGQGSSILKDELSQ